MVMKFKAGDEVKILNKTVFSNLKDTSFKIGDIIKIDFSTKDRLYQSTEICKVLGIKLGFKESDLELPTLQEKLNRKYGYEV
jgi:hypothetical protein